MTASKGDLGLVPAFAIAGAGPWWTALEFDAAPKIIARLPFVERADHPAAHAGVRGVARRGRRHGDRNRSLERARLRLERGLGRQRSPALADAIAVPDRAFDGAALLVSVARGGIDAVAEALRRHRRFDPLEGPRRQPRDPLYGAAENDLPLTAETR